MGKTYLPSGQGATYKNLARFVGGAPFDGRLVVDSLEDISGETYKTTFGGTEFENVPSYYEGMLVVTKNDGKLYVLNNGEFKEVSSSAGSPDISGLASKTDVENALNSANKYTDEQITNLGEIGSVDITQETGNNTEKVMSQDAVTKELNALDSKIDNIVIPNTNGLASETYVNTKVTELSASVNANFATKQELSNKADKDDIPTFANVAISGSYNDLIDKPSIDGLATTTEVEEALTSAKAYTNEEIGEINIPKALSELSDDPTHRLITDDDKQRWDAKSNFSGNYNDLSNLPDIPVYSNGNYITITNRAIAVDTSSLETYFNDKYDKIGTADAVQNNLDQLFNDIETALSGIYLKSETYSQTEVDNKIANAINNAINEVLDTPL